MDFKKRLIEKLDLSTIAANTIYSVYIDVCEEVAEEYAKELIEEAIREWYSVMYDLADDANENEVILFLELHEKTFNP